MTGAGGRRLAGERGNKPASRWEVVVLVRTLVTVAALSVPAEAHAAGYVVQRGDTLSGIAERTGVPVSALAQANGIQQLGLIRPGQVLTIAGAPGMYGYAAVRPYGNAPSTYAPRSLTATSVSPSAVSSAPSGSYTIQWGDTLSGLALRYHTSVEALRAANPSLGPYLITGQRLNLCTTCASGAGVGARSAMNYSSAAPQAVTPYAGQQAYSAYSGAASVGTSASPQPAADSGYQARALITAYAQQYGLDSSLPVAIGAQESGFQQTAVSGAGAIGVMQILPSTASQISVLMGRPVDLYSLDDNIHAGVFWLAHLVALYGGNEQMAAAAYYQGGPSIASRGFYNDTVRYVSGAMALKSRYGG